MNHSTKTLFFIFSVLLSSASCQPHFTNEYPKAEIQPYTLQKKLELLVRDPEIKGYFHLTDSSVIMYADTAEQETRLPEAEILFSEAEVFLNLCKVLDYDSLETVYKAKGQKPFHYDLIALKKEGKDFSSEEEKPLAGKRIALDPGHIGGAMSTALLEDRYVKMLHHQDTIGFNEGNLTLATAYLLKQKLEAAGAEVLMTRTEYGKSSFDNTLTEWIKTNMEAAIQKEMKEEMDPFLAKMLREKNTSDSAYVYHRFFKYKDFEKRAEKINAFQPDLTFIIHYNVDSPNYEKRSEDGIFPPGKDNYSMAFVPGSFMRRELREVRSRIEFLSLLLSDNLSQSVMAADYFEHFHRTLAKVKPVPAESELPYLQRGCIYAGKPGVFARNLSLTRMVHSPVVYGESLCQDHRKEAIALSKEEITVEGKWMPSRIMTVADAYYQTALSYFGTVK